MRTDLTIAIPTYNRARFLEMTLESVYKQIDSCDFMKINVLVSDNASTDNTIEVVQRYTDRGLLYISNNENIGFDRNIDNLAHAANGKYILFISDDDIFVDGCLIHYSDAIKNDVSVAYGAAIFAKHDMSQNVSEFQDTSFDNFIHKKLYYFESGCEYMDFTKKLYCGISGTMFKRDDYLLVDTKQFYGSHFLHIGALFKMISIPDRKICVIAYPTIKYRLGPADAAIKGQDSIMPVGLGLLDLLKKLQADYPARVFKVIYDKELKWVRSLVIGVKSREIISDKYTQKYKELLLPERTFPFVDIVILSAPHLFLKTLYAIYRAFK